MSDYIKLIIEDINDEVLQDILIAELADVGVESFDESPGILNAYILKNNFNKPVFDKIFCEAPFKDKLKYTTEEIKSENWNSVWESNFEPVIIGSKCVIYASFHNNLPEADYKIEINPKMTFGTGHHETTHLCSEAVLDLDCKDKNVLDMGCGTGILGIIAVLKGAAHVTAIDNDPIAVENAIENAGLNNVANKMDIMEGSGDTIKNKHFDIVIANINRNVLLNDMEIYVKTLTKGGTLVISGFYKEDIKLLSETAISLGLQKVDEALRNKWAMLKFILE